MNTGLLTCHLVSLEDIFSYKMMSMKTLKIQKKKLKMKNQLKNHLIQMINEFIKLLFFKMVNKVSHIIFIGNELKIIDDYIIIFKY
jgi:hypothetical protein